MRLAAAGVSPGGDSRHSADAGPSWAWRWRIASASASASVSASARFVVGRRGVIRRRVIGWRVGRGRRWWVWIWMEAVSAVVQTTVAAAGVDAVAMRRIRRGCLDPVAAEGRQAEQSECRGGTKQRQVGKRPGPAPP